MCALMACGSTVGQAVADYQQYAAAELADLSLEELMNVEVYSVAKKRQKLSDSAAAVYILTQEDIRRSGVTTIPEALRLVPGVEVARIDSNKWAITARGFNERFANKLLVLIDGRSVYTPFFAGVYWDVQDAVLEDIDRIEVIRGPGGTLWGANAVNGVINIITKSSKDTQGVLLSGGAGTEEEGFSTARLGFKLSDNAHARVYGKWFQRDDFATETDDDASDEWDAVRGGFRVDWEPAADDLVTLQGDIYTGEVGAKTTVPTLEPPFSSTTSSDSDISGANLLGRWSHTLPGGSNVRLQMYWDRTARKSRITTHETRDTVDVEFQHHVSIADIHDFVWGLNYRHSRDEIDGTFPISLDPDERGMDLVSGFLQDEISLLDDVLRVTLGTKLEYNELSGFEVQPNARALWKVDDRNSLWAAVSRAVRTPSRAEDDIRINSSVFPPGTVPGLPPGTETLPVVVALFGDRSFVSEELIAFELGYRTQPRENFWVDIATFYHLYDDLRTITPAGDPFLETDPLPPHLVVPFSATNSMEGEAWGIEVAADWRPFERWKLRSGYTFLEMDLDLDDIGKADTISRAADGSSPQNQVFVRSLLDLPYDFELDANVKWVDELKALAIDSYATLDLRLGWRPTDSLELSLVGQNLLEREQQQFGSSAFVSDEVTKVERGVYGKVTWRY